MTQMTPGLASGQVNWFKFGAPTNPPVTHATQRKSTKSVRVRALLSLSFDNFVVNALLLAAPPALFTYHVLCIAGGWVAELRTRGTRRGHCETSHC